MSPARGIDAANHAVARGVVDTHHLRGFEMDNDGDDTAICACGARTTAPSAVTAQLIHVTARVVEALRENGALR